MAALRRLKWLRTARPEQITPRGNWDYWAYLAGRGSGKELALDTPVPTPVGWTTMGALQVGDEVFDEAGRPCRVTAVFDTMAEHPYRLTFSDGTVIDAGAAHQWVTWDNAARKAYLRSRHETDTSRPPADWPSWRPMRQPSGSGGRSMAAARAENGPGPRVRTTAEIVAAFRHGDRGDLNHSIPVCGPLDLPGAVLQFDPWAFGFWLGNGSRARPEVTGHAADTDYVVGKIRALGWVGKVRPDVRGARCFSVRADAFRGMPETKRIVPTAYLRASPAQRLDLLRGMMDSDGHADTKKGTVEFCSTEKYLADVVCELAASLGQKPVLAEGAAKLDGVDYGPRWRVTWRPTIQVFGSPRKSGQCRLNGGAQGHRSHHRMIRSFEEIQPQPMRCITVDSPNAMYLVSRAMIPTHNTRSGAEDVFDYCVWNDGARVAVVAPTFGDLRKTIFTGDSGLLSVIPPQCLRGGSAASGVNISLFEIHFWNGSKIEGFSSEEPDRLRGPQFHRAWADELAAWKRLQETWDMLQFGLRLGQNPQVLVTTTPRPLKLIKELINDQRTKISRSSTHANKANLAPSYFDKLRRTYEGTRLGRQEIDGEVLEDTPGALWSLRLIEAHRRRRIDVPQLNRIVIAIDPAVSNEVGSDETGIVVAGKGVDGHGYILEDGSMKGPPKADDNAPGEVGWCDEAVRLYRKWSADRVIGEINNGGALIETVLRVVEPNLPYKAVTASRGKAIRAEPISALYQRGLIHHVGGFSALEDQMATFTSDFDRKTAGYSPDRMDALVWALTELFVDETGTSGIFEHYRQLAQQKQK